MRSTILYCLLSLAIISSCHADPDPSSSPSNATTPIENFISWIHQHEAVIDGIEFGHDDKKGRNVKATRALTNGTMVASIPFDIFFTIEHLEPIDPDLSELLEDISDTNAMAIFLIDQANETDSFWAPYFGILPRNLSSPITWKEPLLMDALKGTSVLGPIKKRRTAVDKRYAALPSILRDHISLDAFHWGLGIIWSRTFSVRAKAPDGKWESGSAFVPIADMFNTDIPSNLNIECYTNQESTHFQCMTTKDVESGQELLAPYSKDLTTGQYLMDYGFVLPNNPYQILVLESIPISKLPTETDDTYKIKYQLIKALGKGKALVTNEESGNPIFQIKNIPINWNISSGLPSTLIQPLTLARILSLLDSDVIHPYASIQNQLLVSRIPLHGASEARACSILLNMFQYTLDQYQISEQLTTLLNEQTCQGVWCDINRLRTQEQQLIIQYMDIITQYQNTLNATDESPVFASKPIKKKKKKQPSHHEDEL